MDEFVLYEDSGAIWRFYGFCDGGHPGRFKSYQHNDESGEVNGFTGYGHIQQLLFKVSGVLAGRYDYSYQVFGDDAERLTKATHYLRDETGTMQKVREADYVYYGDSEAHGSLGDLKTVTVTDYSAAGADPSRTYYYRYELLASGLAASSTRSTRKPSSGSAMIRRSAIPSPPPMRSWPNTPTTPSSTTPTAASSQECTAGCEHPITYSFEEGTAAEGYNNWHLRAAETGSYVVTFTNFRGDVLLREVRESADAQDSAVEYFQYDDNGNLMLHATPAAVESYSYSASSLSVSLKSNEGLIHVYEYYTQTTTGSGGVGVHGLRQYDKIQQGSSGTPITLRKYEYTERSVPVIWESGSSSSSSSSSSGSPPVFTIYPLLRETVYRNEDGTGAIKTSYSYAWHPNSLQIEQRVTTLPAVPAEQDGSGISATRTERFDTHGQPDLEPGRARVHHLPRVRRRAAGGDQDDPGRGRHAADLAQRLEHAGRRRAAPGDRLRVRSARPADRRASVPSMTWTSRGGDHGAHGQLDGPSGCRPGDARGARVLCARDGKLHAGQSGLDHQAQRRRHAQRVDPGHAGLDRRQTVRLRHLRAVQLRALDGVAGQQPGPAHGQPAVPHDSRQRGRGSGHELRRDDVRLRFPGPAEQGALARRHDHAHGVRRLRPRAADLRGHGRYRGHGRRSHRPGRLLAARRPAVPVALTRNNNMVLVTAYTYAAAPGAAEAAVVAAQRDRSTWTPRPAARPSTSTTGGSGRNT